MIDDFMSAHPQYDAAHVREIAEYAAAESIPYCTACHDWHYTNEEHSA